MYKILYLNTNIDTIVVSARTQSQAVIKDLRMKISLLFVDDDDTYVFLLFFPRALPTQSRSTFIYRRGTCAAYACFDVGWYHTLLRVGIAWPLIFRTARNEIKSLTGANRVQGKGAGIIKKNNMFIYYLSLSITN